MHTVADCIAVSGAWAQLCNTAYTLPKGASNMKLYVETESGTGDFFMDEAVCAVENTVIAGAGQPDYTVRGDVNADHVFDHADVISVQKWLLTMPDAEPSALAAADMDQNGTLNAADLSLMKKELHKAAEG